MEVPKYTNEQVPQLIQLFTHDKEVLYLLGRLCYGDWKQLSSEQRKERLQKDLIPIFQRAKSLQDFQRDIVFGFFTRSIINNSVDHIDVEGFDTLDPTKSYLFVSNHRDIILDPLLFNVALGDATNIPYARLVFGDNLLLNPAIAAIFGLSQGLAVQRGGSLRETFEASKQLSAEIVHTIREGQSVWIAQRNGRAKDGRDITEPAVLKMFHMVYKEEGLSFQQFLAECPIVPLSLSYQVDPCDTMKAWEIYRALGDETRGKRKYADLASALASIKTPKGGVSIRVGEPLSPEIETVKEAAQVIDREIQGNYKLWETNYIAHDLCHAPRYEDKYTKDQKESFLHRFNGLPQGVRDIAIRSYCNPVELYQKVHEE